MKLMIMTTTSRGHDSIDNNVPQERAVARKARERDV